MSTLKFPRKATANVEAKPRRNNPNDLTLLSLEQAAVVLGCTRSTAQRIEQSALLKLRDGLIRYVDLEHGGDK